MKERETGSLKEGIKWVFKDLFTDLDGNEVWMKMVEAILKENVWFSFFFLELPI